MGQSLVSLALLLVCVLLGNASANAQGQTSGATSPITTDRPSTTDSSVVVPDGDLQFENGFTETANLGQSGFDFPETLVRFGLTGKTELRFTAPDYFQNFNTGAGFGTGWGDISAGAKQQLFASDKFDASLVVAVSLPTGAKTISSHGYDPQVLLPWSLAVSKNWTSAGMFSLLWPTEGLKRNLTGQASFLLERQISRSWGAFVEYGGEFPQRGGPQHIVHSGTTFSVTSNQQFDFHVGFGLSSAAPDHFIGFGYSIRFQAIHINKHHGS